MTEVQILLDIQRTLGSLEASQAAVNDKLDDIHEQVKYTNGRVNKLRSEVDQLINDGNGKKKVSVSLSKEQIAIIVGAVLAFSTYILDKLT